MSGDSNHEEQKDELLALDTILNEDFGESVPKSETSQKVFHYQEILDQDGSEFFFEGFIHVKLDLEQDLEIVNSASYVIPWVAKQEKFREFRFRLEVEKFLVAHLPPIRLNFKLPKNYPSENRPNFELSCPWLLASQVNSRNLISN